jgi:Zn-dependent peptidase ImmA (M78 family)
MLDESSRDLLETIFYDIAPEDYLLVFKPNKPKRLHGYCTYDQKVCVVYNNDFWNSLFTMLHELAHAITGHGHTAEWEKTYVRLLIKYDFPRDKITDNHVFGPALREWANAT